MALSSIPQPLRYLGRDWSHTCGLTSVNCINYYSLQWSTVPQQHHWNRAQPRHHNWSDWVLILFLDRVGKIMVPTNVHTLILAPVNMLSYSHRDFAGVTKVMDVGMGRLSWVIWPRPFYSHTFLKVEGLWAMSMRERCDFRRRISEQSHCCFWNWPQADEWRQPLDGKGQERNSS